MRLNLKLTGNTESVPFNHVYRLIGTIHKWLGPDNDLHDELSLYSFGQLRGGTRVDNHLHFAGGAGWRLGFHNPDVARQVMKGILREPTVAYGMRVFEIREQAVPHFSGCYRFKVDSPVIARKNRDDGGRDYLLWHHPEADDALSHTLQHKLTRAGYQGEDLNVRVQFDRTYGKARSQLIQIKGIAHRGSVCPVVVTGTPAAVQFAWLVGVGELTGSGFGALL